jgi:hypothetical protein
MSSSSSKHSSSLWGEWSDWILHPSHSRYYRVRQNAAGSSSLSFPRRNHVVFAPMALPLSPSALVRLIEFSIIQATSIMNGTSRPPRKMFRDRLTRTWIPSPRRCPGPNSATTRMKSTRVSPLTIWTVISLPLASLVKPRHCPPSRLRNYTLTVAVEYAPAEDEYTTDPESKNKGKHVSSKHKSRRSERDSHHSSRCKPATISEDVT